MRATDGSRSPSNLCVPLFPPVATWPPDFDGRTDTRWSELDTDGSRSPQNLRVPLFPPVAIWPPDFEGRADTRWSELDNKKRVCVCDKCLVGFPGEVKLPGNHRVKPGGYVQEKTRATIQRGRDPVSGLPIVPFKDLVGLWEGGLDMTWWCIECLQRDPSNRAAYNAWEENQNAMRAYYKRRKNQTRRVKYYTTWCWQRFLIGVRGPRVRTQLNE